MKVASKLLKKIGIKASSVERLKEFLKIDRDQKNQYKYKAKDTQIHIKAKEKSFNL
jgi:hypothetical protein